MRVSLVFVRMYMKFLVIISGETEINKSIARIASHD